MNCSNPVGTVFQCSSNRFSFVQETDVPPVVSHCGKHAVAFRSLFLRKQRLWFDGADGSGQPDHAKTTVKNEILQKQSLSFFRVDRAVLKTKSIDVSKLAHQLLAIRNGTQSSAASPILDSALIATTSNAVTTHIFHHMQALYHTNLMHSLFRVMAILHHVRKVVDDVRLDTNSVPNRCPRLVTANARLVLVTNGNIIPDTPEATISTSAVEALIGFYYPFIMLLINNGTILSPVIIIAQSKSEACFRQPDISRHFLLVAGKCEDDLVFESSVAGYLGIPFLGAESSQRASIREFSVLIRNSLPYSTASVDHQRIVIVTLINRARSRRILNIDLLANAIRSISRNISGRVVYLDSPPLNSSANNILIDQAEFVARSSVLVAVHGAALAWSIALPPSAHVVELFPPGWDEHVGLSSRRKSLFSSLSEAAGVSSHNIIALESRDASYHRMPSNIAAGVGGSFSMKKVDYFSSNLTLSAHGVETVVSHLRRILLL